MDFQDDGADFNTTDVEQIVKNAIPTCLGESLYNGKKINDWINNIVDSCLKELLALNKPFKYIITCNITQKNGAGMTTASSQYWDGNKDRMVTVFFENATINCCVTVYGVAVNIDNAPEME